MTQDKRILLVFLAALSPLSAWADLPGQHPYYLHALSDLRAARWLIDHRPGNPAVSNDESAAIAYIDATINEIKHAAINDGKDIDNHQPVDDQLDYQGRLRRADDLLRKVHSDIAREEDDPSTRGLRDRAVRHLDDAINATDAALRAAHRG